MIALLPLGIVVMLRSFFLIFASILDKRTQKYNSLKEKYMVKELRLHYLERANKAMKARLDTLNLLDPED